MKTYPLQYVPTLVGPDGRLKVRVNPSLEGITVTEDDLHGKNLLSLEFCWLPANVVEAYNGAATEQERRKVLVDKVYGNCRLNCKGCYAKQDDLFHGHDLVHPDRIMDLIEESVRELGTKSVKYLGPSEFFRDRDVFRYLDRFEKMDIVLGIFVKDPMFGDDKEVETLFGGQGIHTSEELIKKLASYRCLRILFNFRSFDDAITNDLVRGGYAGKEDYSGDYKTVQNRAVGLLYEYFARREFDLGLPARLLILNAPVTPETVGEASEIFRYFTDRGLPVVSTASMRSGCGAGIYAGADERFSEELARFYAEAMRLSVERELVDAEYFERNGPSPYAGMMHCFQLCNGLLIRETGQLLRCPGADHAGWLDLISSEELLRNGIAWAWPHTMNHDEPARLNVGCLAKPRIFTAGFNSRVMTMYRSL
jgi:hypothetical protein